MGETACMVSVCCLTYNQAPFVRSALEGFIRQETDFSFEVLIHDDASTDGTAGIIREYESRYPRLIFPIYQTENQYSRGLTNISGTFNFPRARGRYIAMCEGDDFWTDRHKLKKQVDYLESHPDCPLCLHSARIEVVGRALTGRRMRPYRGDRRLSSGDIIDKHTGYPTASLLFRRELVENLPDFYTRAPIADIPLQLLAAAAGGAYYMDSPMCTYRLGGAASWTAQMKQGDYAGKQARYRSAMEEMYREFDAWSGGRYHETVVRAARRLAFLTGVNLRRFDVVFAPGNRAFYRELGAETRFFLRFEKTAPGLYRALQTAFHRLPGKREGRDGGA